MKKLSAFLFIKNHFAFLALVVCAGVLFLYNQTGSLQPWDEAWYGAITQNMIETKNPFVLQYNQHFFYDHPPLGFQLKAISMWFLGRSTLSIRLPEMLAGLLALVALYKTGSLLSSKWAGIWAAVILLTSRWFLFRARLGNLDILLLSTQLWTVSALFQMVSQKKVSLSHPKILSLISTHKWFLLTFFFLGLSILSKALISLQLLPLVVLGSISYFRTQRFDIKTVVTLSLFGLTALALPLMPWFIANMSVDSSDFIGTLKTIGFRSNTKKEFNITYIQTVIQYTQAAMHRWFKIAVISSAISVLLMGIRKYTTLFFFLVLYTFLVFAPYVISEKTEIWHLLPGVAALSLVSGVALDTLLNTLQPHLKKILKKNFSFFHTKIHVFLKLGVTAVLLSIGVFNLRNYWSEFLNVYQYPSDYEKITWHIPYLNEPVYTTTDAYFPGLVYYAHLKQQPVIYLSDSEDIMICTEKFTAGAPLQIVSRYGDWVMDKLHDTYLVAREGDLVLSVIPPEGCEAYLLSKSIQN